METPLVSICSITYNHALFIRQCLDGFLMQQCNFPIEIIINDDCSTDGTTEIIREYAEKHPDKIFPIFHEENLYSQGVRGMFQKFVFPKARGKYIALCEGDDYWTDPLKLQKQVDFLESHPDYSMCFHGARVVTEQGRINELLFRGLCQREYFPEELLTSWLVPTASMVFRAEVIEKVPQHKYFRSGDILIYTTCLSCGRVYCMLEEMSVYRRHMGGWTAQKQTRFSLYKEILHYRTMIVFFPSHVINCLKPMLARWCVVALKENRLTTPLISLSVLYTALRYCRREFFMVIEKYAKNNIVKSVCSMFS